MPMNAHYHDFLCEWRCYFGQQVAPKDTIIFIAQRVRDVTENLQNVYDTQKKRLPRKLYELKVHAPHSKDIHPPQTA